MRRKEDKHFGGGAPRLPPPPFPSLSAFSSHAAQHSFSARPGVRAGTPRSAGRSSVPVPQCPNQHHISGTLSPKSFSNSFLEGFMGQCWPACMVFAGTAQSRPTAETAHLSAEQVPGLALKHHHSLASTCLSGQLSQPVPLPDRSLVPSRPLRPVSVPPYSVSLA